MAAGWEAEGADAQYGDANVWTSPDGLVWQRQPSGSEFVASEITALVHWGNGLIAVGDSGLPDDFAATVWRSPEAWIR